MENFCGVPLTKDIYNGVHLDLKCILEQSAQDQNKLETFAKSLDKEIDETLSKWIEQGVKCVWVIIPGEMTNVVPLLFKRSFEFHHTKPHQLVMMKWVSKTGTRLSPGYAHTMIGVGGLVVDPKAKKVLLIQEKNAQVKMWKFPGGYNEINEDLPQTAVREVREETGIECDFHSLITFRHRHQAAFDCSDLYFVVLLQPKTAENEIRQCQFEIDKCAWLDYETASKELLGFNKYVFDRFLEQYSKTLNKEARTSNDSLTTSVTINSEVVKCEYKQLKREERVYFVGCVKPFKSF